MKISDVTADYLADYLRLEPGDYDPEFLEAVMAGAKGYIASHTGLPETAEKDAESIDTYSDLTIAFLVLCQDMYDNRAYTADTDKTNKCVENIVAMHARNLV